MAAKVTNFRNLENGGPAKGVRQIAHPQVKQSLAYRLGRDQLRRGSIISTLE